MSCHQWSTSSSLLSHLSSLGGVWCWVQCLLVHILIKSRNLNMFEWPRPSFSVCSASPPDDRWFLALQWRNSSIFSLSPLIQESSDSDCFMAWNQVSSFTWSNKGKSTGTLDEEGDRWVSVEQSLEVVFLCIPPGNLAEMEQAAFQVKSKRSTGPFWVATLKLVKTVVGAKTMSRDFEAI